MIFSDKIKKWKFTRYRFGSGLQFQRRSLSYGWSSLMLFVSHPCMWCLSSSLYLNQSPGMTFSSSPDENISRFKCHQIWSPEIVTFLNGNWWNPLEMYKGQYVYSHKFSSEMHVRIAQAHWKMHSFKPLYFIIIIIIKPTFTTTCQSNNNNIVGISFYF